MPAPIDIYVRVSRVAGREGDSFQSPEQQEAICRSQLAALGLEAGRVFTDLDESGGKTSRPEFDKLMARIHAGASGGIVVSKLNRFMRLRAAVEAVLEVEASGAKFVCVEPMIDTSTPTGRFVLSVFAALAQMELEQLTEQWKSAQRSFLARNGHGGPFVPSGYDRQPGGQLVPNADAAAIKRAFELRAQGVTLKEVGRFLGEAGVVIREHGKPEHAGYRAAHSEWLPSAVRSMLRNPVYLGVARAGGEEKQGAHEAIVTRAEYDAAQTKRPAGRVRNGEASEGALLTGLLTCATCGSPLTNDGVRYRCNSRGHRAAPCEKRALIRRTVVEPYVEEKTLEFLGHVEYGKKTRGGELPERLERAVADCEAELRAYVELTPAATLGYADGLARREAALRTARAALGASGRFDEEWVTLSAVETVETYRRMSLPDKRKVIAACLRSGVVTPGAGNVEDRVAIEFAPHSTRKTVRPAWIDAPLEYVEG